MVVSYKASSKSRPLEEYSETYYCGECMHRMKRIDGKDTCMNKKCPEYGIRKGS